MHGCHSEILVKTSYTMFLLAATHEPPEKELTFPSSPDSSHGNVLDWGLPLVKLWVQIPAMEKIYFSVKPEQINSKIRRNKPSRGGLEVEAWTDNSLHSASVGSNPV